MSELDRLLRTSHLMMRLPKPKIIERAEGIYLIDREGRRYIDGSGGPICVGIGYGVQEVIEAMQEQARKISFWGSAVGLTPIALEWAEALSKFAPGDLKYVSPTAGGGSDSTDAAIKLARQYWVEKGRPTKHRVVSRWMSWHGSSMGALSVSGHIVRRRLSVPYLPNWPKIPPAYCYRCWYGKVYPDCDLACARELERTIRVEGAEHITMFIAEPIVGSALGTVPAPKEYFKIIRETCDKYEILFCTDEVMTGFGRTGKNFGIEHWGVLPDLMICAKGMTSGYMPMGAVVVSDKIHDAFKEHLAQVGTTYSAHPTSCAVSLAVINYIVKNNLVQNVANLEKRFLDGLKRLNHHRSVGDVRGKGFFAGIEFVKGKDTKEMFEPEVRFSRRLQNRCWENGLSLYVGTDVIPGMVGDTIQIAPMLICNASDIDTIIDIIDRSLTQVEDNLSGKP